MLVSVVFSHRGPGLAFVVHVGSGRSRILVVVRVTSNVKKGLVVPHGPPLNRGRLGHVS